MYYDLNIPWPVALGEASEPLKKGVKRKGTGDKDVGRTDNGKQGGSEAFSDSDLGGLSAAQRAHMTALVADAAECEQQIGATLLQNQEGRCLLTA